MPDPIRYRAVVTALLVASCGSPPAPAKTTAADTAAEVAATDTTAPDVVDTAVVQADTAPADTTTAGDVAAAAVCEGETAAPTAFSTGPFGVHRHDIAADFSMDLVDGTTFEFSKAFTGCDSYVFVPDSIPISELTPASIWTKDVAALLKNSPKNVHYFFVSRSSNAANVEKVTADMQDRVLAALTDLDADTGAHWFPRLHVAKKSAMGQGNWVGEVLANGHGRIGFGIDRWQRIRGFGMLADVTRSDPKLQAAGKWPWQANLAYAAHEPQAWNAEFARYTKLQAAKTTVVELWKGETLAEFAETDANLPGAPTMATYDTLQIEVDMRCPKADDPEPGNCGAWDYLAGLSVQSADGKNIEIARFITSYHRETHWLVDVTPMLALLQAGGKRHFRWDFAPSWNTQPTNTWLKLHLSNQNKGIRPVAAMYLWGDAAFNSKYDAAHPDQTVNVPPTAKQVQLWALVTGHGADKATQCAEFCNHEHHFGVNGTPFVLNFPMAGTQSKCMDNIGNGMSPNQGGTWWFGRGGWCPGMQVQPWMQDVTAQAKAGSAVKVSYAGKLGGKTPPDGEGNIHLTSYLVVYE